MHLILLNCTLAKLVMYGMCILPQLKVKRGGGEIKNMASGERSVLCSWCYHLTSWGPVDNSLKLISEPPDSSSNNSASFLGLLWTLNEVFGMDSLCTWYAAKTCKRYKLLSLLFLLNAWERGLCWCQSGWWWSILEMFRSPAPLTPVTQILYLLHIQQCPIPLGNLLSLFRPVFIQWLKQLYSSSCVHVTSLYWGPTVSRSVGNTVGTEPSSCFQADYSLVVFYTVSLTAILNPVVSMKALFSPQYCEFFEGENLVLLFFVSTEVLSLTLDRKKNSHSEFFELRGPREETSSHMGLESHSVRKDLDRKPGPLPLPTFLPSSSSGGCEFSP